MIDDLMNLPIGFSKARKSVIFCMKMREEWDSFQHPLNRKKMLIYIAKTQKPDLTLTVSVEIPVVVLTSIFWRDDCKLRMIWRTIVLSKVLDPRSLNINWALCSGLSLSKTDICNEATKLNNHADLRTVLNCKMLCSPVLLSHPIKVWL